MQHIPDTHVANPPNTDVVVSVMRYLFTARVDSKQYLLQVLKRACTE